MKSTRFLAVGLILSILIATVVVVPHTKAQQEGKPQTTCPVMGGPINKTAYVDYEGKRVYFCCPGCKSTFLKDPQKYLSKMKSEGIALEAAPTSKKSPQ